MIRYLKNELTHIPFIAITISLLYGIVLLFNSYTNVNATGVTCAVDSNFSHSSGYNSMDTRLTGIQSTIGNTTLTTTAQNLTGAINEIKTNLLSNNGINDVVTWNTTYVGTNSVNVRVYGKVLMLRFTIALLDNLTDVTTIGTIAKDYCPQTSYNMTTIRLSAGANPDKRLLQIVARSSAATCNIRIHGASKSTSSSSTQYTGTAIYLLP